MSANLYRSYLFADQLSKRLESLGYAPRDGVTIVAEWEGKPYTALEERSYYERPTVEVTGVRSEDLLYPPAEEITALAEAWTERWPATRIHYSSGSIYLFGDLVEGGGPFRIYLGKGVCEQVVVGYREVVKPAPDAPTIVVQEPLYEYRCPDPLAAQMAGARS